jgi:hypothetical protein
MARFLRSGVGRTTRAVCALAVLAAVASASSPAAGASAARWATLSPTASFWAPSLAPLPATLPNGDPPSAVAIRSVSCASAAFCVAVGDVTDAKLNVFPLAEIWSKGTWAAEVLATPANRSTNLYIGVLDAVSCPTTGSCAAVGAYSSSDPSSGTAYQNGLLELFRSGMWTPSEAALPAGPDSGLVNLSSVSCASAEKCTAVGEVYRDDHWTGLLYSLSSAGWTLQVAPVPSGYRNSLSLDGVSCPGGACTVVGSYQDSQDEVHGLILTSTRARWTARQAPKPADVASGPHAGERDPFESLASIDCPVAGWCVAVGYYVDKQYHVDPLVLQLSAGVWKATGGPVPANSQAATLAALTGVYCPVEGVCVAIGYYWPDYPTSESGMILVDAGGSWTAVPAPLPKAGSTASLAGVACVAGGRCMAGGVEGSDGLLEAGTVGTAPTSRLYERTGATAVRTTLASSRYAFAAVVGWSRPMRACHARTADASRPAEVDEPSSGRMWRARRYA